MPTPTTNVRRVKDIMSRDVVSLHAADTVHEALAQLVENRVSALPIVDKHNHCVGILSTTDLIDVTRALDQDLVYAGELDTDSQRWLFDRLTHTVGDEPLTSYMTENVTTVRSEDTLAEAAREMLRNRVHHLPVVDAKDHLVGIVSTMDILGALAETQT